MAARIAKNDDDGDGGGNDDDRREHQHKKDGAGCDDDGDKEGMMAVVEEHFEHKTCHQTIVTIAHCCRRNTPCLRVLCGSYEHQPLEYALLIVG